MVNFSTTIVLLSNKNYELSFALKNLCRDLRVNLVYVYNYFDLTFKIVNINPSIIIYDLTTIDIDNNMLDYITDNENYRGKDNILYTNDKTIDNSRENFLYANLSNVVEIVRDIYNRYKFFYSNLTSRILSNEQINVISSYLKALGMSPRHIGYNFVKEIIIFSLQYYNAVLPMLSDCYSFISAKYNTNCINIERSIRHCINCAWKNFGERNWKMQFGLVGNLDKKPTIRDFVCNCLEQLSFELNKSGKIKSYI